MTTRPTDLDRHLRMYRALLVLYPQEFRAEWGDDMVQAFGDLLLLSQRRGRGAREAWLRTTRDLVTSAPRERGAAMSPRGPALVALVALIALMLLGLAVAGHPGAGSFGAMAAVLIVLPVVGVAQLHRTRMLRRTTGVHAPGRIAVGIGAFVPGAIWLVATGPDRMYYAVAATLLAIVIASVVAVLAAIAALITDGGGRARGRVLLVGGAGLAVLLLIIGAGTLSWWRSQPPPGDHSVENASPESQALWQAAVDGDVDAVSRLSRTCADPFVQFSGDGIVSQRARGAADSRLLELPDAEEPPYREIMTILDDAEDTWSDRCGPD